MFYVVASSVGEWGANSDLAAAKKRARARGNAHMIYTFDSPEDFATIDQIGYIRWHKDPVKVVYVENGQTKTVDREDW